MALIAVLLLAVVTAAIDMPDLSSCVLGACENPSKNLKNFEKDVKKVDEELCKTKGQFIKCLEDTAASDKCNAVEKKLIETTIKAQQKFMGDAGCGAAELAASFAVGLGFSSLAVVLSRRFC